MGAPVGNRAPGRTEFRFGHAARLAILTFSHQTWQTGSGRKFCGILQSAQGFYRPA